MSYRSQLITAYHHLATMLNAGLPILRAFDTVTTHARGSLRRTFVRVSRSLAEGKTVTEAFDDFPGVFARFDRTLIKAADESGHLDTCFAMLSDWYEFLRQIKRKAMAGLLYPLFILHVAVMVVQIPDVVLGDTTTAGAVINVVQFLAVVVYVPWFLLWLIVARGPQWPAVRVVLDHMLLRIPLLGQGIRELCISRFCRAFGMLYKAGVPMSECFAFAPKATGNYSVAGLFSGGIDKIAEGKVPSEGFSRRLPAEYLDLWTIGEETGDLDRCVDKIAEIAADRADLRIRLFARGLPWVIYILVMIYMTYKILEMAQGVYGNIGAGF